MIASSLSLLFFNRFGFWGFCLGFDFGIISQGFLVRKNEKGIFLENSGFLVVPATAAGFWAER